MLYKNARIENAEETRDIRVRNGSFEEIAPGLSPLEGEETEDLGGRLVLPPFVEPHIHLDPPP